MLATENPAPQTAGPGDVSPLSRTLAAAFDGYPLTEWVVRRDARHEERRCAYFEMFLRHGSEHGEVVCSEDRRGAAIWFPPDAWNVGLGALLARLPLLLRAMGWRKLVSRIAGLRRLAAHHPEEPHWYLEVIGTHPGSQGTGVGSMLLEAGLARARADGVGAYLITSNEKIIPFYTARGFALRDEICVSGGPTCWSLWHDR